ncbi:MAG: hypothetical protein BWY06_03295 [Candidatus Latescibacteria bacterium ADurb.Bin168]|nr:MAG: hypothetical protein BWY06_03295 [Candidatus Latescibacteria bacterium ADurb.Bin168]
MDGTRDFVLRNQPSDLADDLRVGVEGVCDLRRVALDEGQLVAAAALLAVTRIRVRFHQRDVVRVLRSHSVEFLLREQARVHEPALHECVPPCVYGVCAVCDYLVLGFHIRDKLFQFGARDRVRQDGYRFVAVHEVERVLRHHVIRERVEVPAVNACVLDGLRHRLPDDVPVRVRADLVQVRNRHSFAEYAIARLLPDGQPRRIADGFVKRCNRARRIDVP